MKAVFEVIQTVTVDDEWTRVALRPQSSDGDEFALVELRHVELLMPSDEVVDYPTGSMVAVEIALAPAS